jgi:hypothetical protein
MSATISTAWRFRIDTESMSCTFYTSNVTELLISLFWQSQLINIKARLEIKDQLRDIGNTSGWRFQSNTHTKSNVNLQEYVVFLSNVINIAGNFLNLILELFTMVDTVSAPSMNSILNLAILSNHKESDLLIHKV